jgi:ADP-sugar diphosphatase
MTEQPRIPAGSLSFLEIPAGMRDGDMNFKGAAAKEIREETGLVMKSSELINLTELALQESKVKEKNLQNAMYPSPGGSDEFIAIFLWEKVSMRS